MRSARSSSEACGIAPNDALAASFSSRLTPKDRARSLVVSGTPEGFFRVVYRFENEQLVEVQNRTVHAAALSALVKREDSYRFYFAVYVRQRTWITPFYMALIDPFPKMDHLPGLAEKHSCNLGSEYLTK